MNTPQTLHTQDERTFAALAHGSGLLSTFGGGFLGIIAALVIWLTQKEKSAWVAFHALQSLVLQGVILVFILLIVGGTWVIGFLISFITIGFGTIITVPIMILTMFLGMAIGLGGLIYQLVAAVQIYNGKEFRYKWIGDWVARRMSTAPQAVYHSVPPAPPGQGEPVVMKNAPVPSEPSAVSPEPPSPTTAVASEPVFTPEPTVVSYHPAEPEPPAEALPAEPVQQQGTFQPAAESQEESSALASELTPGSEQIIERTDIPEIHVPTGED